jgi:dipeptidyl-peptidase 4
MIKKFFTGFFLVLPISLILAGNQPLSLDSIVTGAYKPEYIPEMRSMQDAGKYTCISDDGKKINSFDYRTGKIAETIIDLDKVKGVKLNKISGYCFDNYEKKILIWEAHRPIYRHSFLTEYYVYDRKRNFLESLSEKGNQRDAKFSPDGRSIAFCRDNNIYIKRLDYGSELEVTTDGSANSIINGSADWVYEEEFVITCAFDWSPDSKSLAYIKFDEREVPEYSFTKFGAFRTDSKRPVFYPGLNTFKYPSAGDKNSKVSVMVFQMQTRSTKKMNLPIAEDDYIPRILFTKNNNQIAVLTINHSQNMFKMYFANPKSATATLILTDQNDTYYDPSFIDAITFSTKYFTYVGEKDGYRHLYLYNANGGLRRQLTSGKWDITGFLGCDTIKNRFFYQSAEESPLRRSVYYADLKGDKLKLSTHKGTCNASFNSDYSLFVQTSSDLNTPINVGLYDLSGKVVRSISDNGKLKDKLSGVAHNEKTFFTVTAVDGQELNGWMLKPSDFDKSKKYPVVQIQYSGPDHQEVLDKYSFDWEYYLAEKGFIVVCVDGRGTGGRGEAFRKCTYKKIGLLESEDQITVSKYLQKLSFIDGNRIGIWGWSFGGFITLMTMTDNSSIFKAGIAVAPVCDYRYYDSVYTERFMQTPGENEDGYNISSPLLRAANLKGKLLLVHGLADDNVRANQSLDFSEALIRAGIQFDTQFYPTSSHSILGETYRKHLYKKMADFFIEKL